MKHQLIGVVSPSGAELWIPENAIDAIYKIKTGCVLLLRSGVTWSISEDTYNQLHNLWDTMNEKQGPLK